MTPSDLILFALWPLLLGGFVGYWIGLSRGWTHAKRFFVYDVLEVPFV